MLRGLQRNGKKVKSKVNQITVMFYFFAKLPRQSKCDASRLLRYPLVKGGEISLNAFLGGDYTKKSQKKEPEGRQVCYYREGKNWTCSF